MTAEEREKRIAEILCQSERRGYGPYTRDQAISRIEAAEKVQRDFEKELDQTEEQVEWIGKHTPQIAGGEVI